MDFKFMVGNRNTARGNHHRGQKKHRILLVESVGNITVG